MTFNNILIVSGTGRNVGKTKFLCQVIQMISYHLDIYAIKTSEIFPDGAIRKNKYADYSKDYSIYEETRKNVPKDTSRMLEAGARKAFYLRSEEENLYTGFGKLFKTIPKNAPVICESNNLGRYLNPGLSVIVTLSLRSVNSFEDDRLKDADALFRSDGKSGFPDHDRIQFIDGMWHLM